MAGPYKLKLTKLSFLSSVDAPAQGDGARALLLKRDGGAIPVEFTAKVAKTHDALGLVFGYAFASSLDGGKTAHIDYQDDVVDPDFLKAAMDWLADGGATDVNHDFEQDGRVIFAWPLLPDINKALGISADKVGLAVAVKPSAETYKRFQSGELTGFSIAGMGERTPLVTKGTWTTATVDDFPDSSFLYVEPGGSKDSAGKTTPRSLRHFPYRDASGKIDIDHLRNAISRIPQSSLPATLRDKLQVKAEKLLAKQHDLSKSMPTGKCTAGHDMPVDKSTCPDCGAKMAYKSIRKAAPVMTSDDAGHQHIIDLDDAAISPADELRTDTAIDADGNWHDHAWLFDASTGAVTIAANAGHDHTVDQALDAQTLMAAAMLAMQPDEPLGSDAVPSEITDEESSGKVSIEIAMRSKSTPARAVKHAANTTEKSQMPTEQEKQIAELTKRAERAEKLATLSDAQRAYLKSLSGDAADAFLAKSYTDRDVVLADIEKANEVVYTTKDGRTFRKSDDVRMVEMAKQLDKQADELAKRDAAIEKAEIATLAKANLGGLAGADDVHQFVIAACRKAGDAAMFAKALTAMKAWKDSSRIGKSAPGFNPQADATADASPQAQWDAEVAKLAAENKLSIAKATELFADSEVGKQIYAEIQKAKKANA